MDLGVPLGCAEAGTPTGKPMPGSWLKIAAPIMARPAMIASLGYQVAPRPGPSVARQANADRHPIAPKTAKFVICTHPPGPRLNALIG